MKRTFKVEIDEKERELQVKKPTHKAVTKAQMIYNRAFRQAVCPSDGGEGCLVRAKIEQVAREMNLWNDARQKRHDELVAALIENEKKLRGGKMKLSEGRKIALQMRKDRAEWEEIRSSLNELDGITAEAQAEQARFNFYVANCTVDGENDKPFFKSVEDYEEKADQPYCMKIAMEFAKLYYGHDDDRLKKLPENAFLIKYGFMDKDLWLINKERKRVDEDGRLLDENGRYVDEDGNFIDRDGNRVDEEGNLVIEEGDFLDDEGNPVVVEEEVAVA